MTLAMKAKEVDTGRSSTLVLPLTAYDAEVVCDLILSYAWLAENQMILNPGRHGLHIMENDRLFWVAGMALRDSRESHALGHLPIVSVPLLDEAPPQEVEATVQAISNLWDGYEKHDATVHFIRALRTCVTLRDPSYTTSSVLIVAT
jgi:hypothetical protein